MESRSKTVVITGAESTGKSALGGWLSEFLSAPYLPEFAREYVEKLGRRYSYSDVEAIARQQVRQLDALRQQGHPVIFADTWLIITKIWFEEVFQLVPKWLEPEIEKGQIDFFLVCDTDLAWIPDNVRENGGERRKYLQGRYIETIKKYGFRYEIISGMNNARNLNAISSLVQNQIIKPFKT